MMRRLRERGHSEEGISMVEMLVSLSIITIGLLALLSTLTASAHGIVEQRTRASATRVASEHLERLRVRVWSDLSTFDFAQLPLTWQESTTVDGRLYTIDTTVTGVRADTGTAGSDIKEITATVSWLSGSTPRSVQVRTVVSTKGEIAVNAPQLLVDMQPNPTPTQDRGDGYFIPQADITVSATLQAADYSGNVLLSWTNGDGTNRQQWLTDRTDDTWSGTIPASTINAAWPATRLDNKVLFTVSAGPTVAEYEFGLFGYDENLVYLFDYGVTPDPIRVRSGNVCGYLGDNGNLDEIRLFVSALPDDIAPADIQVQASWDGSPNSTFDGTNVVPVSLSQTADPRLWEVVIPVGGARLQVGTRTFTISATSNDPRAGSSSIQFTHDVVAVAPTGMPPGDNFVYTASEDKTARKLSTINGAQSWMFQPSPTDFWLDVQVDNSYVYLAGKDRTVRKLDLAGNQIWSFAGHTGEVFAVAADRDGYVYSASKDKTVRKISPAGVQVWSTTISGEGNDVAVDAAGNVYVAASDKKVHKLNSSGAVAWTVAHADTVYSVAVDAAGNVYTGSRPKDVRKLSPTGASLWTYNGFGNDVWAVAVDTNGYVYAAGQDRTVRKLTAAAGALVWSYTNSDEVYAVAIDLSGNVYFGDRGHDVRRLTSAGVLNGAMDIGGRVRGVAVPPGQLAIAGHCG